MNKRTNDEDTRYYQQPQFEAETTTVPISNNRESEQHSRDQSNADRSELRESEGSTEEDAQELGNNCQNQQAENSGTIHNYLRLPDGSPSTA
ncbi:MAG TPA: hypothetical protein VGC60_15465 [Pyrinomonadaceae bacterium]